MMATDLVGLLPAAGRGSRLGAIPCSKEIMPLGFQLQAIGDGRHWRPITALETHLKALRCANVTRAAIIISESKADIVRYIGNGERYGISITYLYQQQLSGMPFALDLATSWIGKATTVFSMPDTIIEPIDTMMRVVEQHLTHPADVTLGLFQTTTPHKFGMVEVTSDAVIRRFIDKPLHTDLTLMWGLAVWSPRFTQYMSAFLKSITSSEKEIVLSDIFQAALEGGLTFRGVVLEDARYRDIGTPEDFQAVVYDLALQQASLLQSCDGFDAS
ncbi:sugar phosphate nucleotidyltransferase [Kallotenue papyrolyticum]|uniref:sugar phosphate nucleotidyltransferase n=1 Tax=Kallotenue papyrolyticum TaxID=1325125 RepID=UPI0009DDBF46